MKVAINRCYGGFGASDALYGFLIARGWSVTRWDDEKGDYVDQTARIAESNSTFKGDSKYYFVDNTGSVEFRTDADLIEGIELLGETANAFYSKLQVVEIPDDVEFTIESYDGFEHIAEVHRTWP